MCLILTWQKCRIILHLNNSSPLYIPQPHMLLDFIRPVKSQPIRRFALQAFIYKVRCFHAPAIWYVRLLQLYLLLEYLVSDFFPALPQVRALAKHELIAHNAKCEVINRHSVVLSAHYFWGHVAGGPRGVMGVIWRPHS